MNAFIALLVATLAVAAQAGNAPTSWPLNGYGADHSWNGLNTWNGLNSWNGLNTWNGYNSWNTHAAYPYGVNQWSSAAAWPAYNSYNGWYGYGKAAPLVQATIAKVNPWGLPLTGYGYGYNNYLEADKYVSPVAHAGYGYGYNNYLGASVVPVASKYVAVNPGSVHVAPLAGHAINQKLIVA